MADSKERDKVVHEKDESDNSKEDDQSEGVPAGAILENGEINWDCPCMGGFQNGPCGQTFRDSFTCFIQSKAEPKGSDCYEQMREWSQCMKDNAEYYDKLKEKNENNDEDSDNDDNDNDGRDQEDDDKSS